jgi:hypothetical protein
VSDGPVAEILFPEEWLTSGWMLTQVLRVVEVEGGHAAVAGGVLKDGANLLGLAFPGGQCVLRSSPDTGWAIEERFSGRLLMDDDPLRALWRIAVESQVNAGKQMRLEEGSRG